MSTTQMHTTTSAAATRSRTSTPERRQADAGTTSRERLRAQGALIVLWAGLAVAILAYAIAEESAGALALAGLVTWLLRVAWSLAIRSRDGEHATPIQFH
jgi:hypothetical protein